MARGGLWSVPRMPPIHVSPLHGPGVSQPAQLLPHLCCLQPQLLGGQGGCHPLPLTPTEGVATVGLCCGSGALQPLSGLTPRPAMPYLHHPLILLQSRCELLYPLPCLRDRAGHEGPWERAGGSPGDS